jgi:hypothetical protein
MNRVITFLLLMFICSCAPQQIIKEQKPDTPPSLANIPTQTMEEPAFPTKESVTPLFGVLLSDVKISKTSFNPGLGEELALYYHLSKPAKVTMHVYDPDHGLIRMLATEKDVNAGEHTIIWDGKDLDGNLVPDEAYFFTIMAEDESGAKEIYDSTTFSGGAEHDITTAEVNPQSQTITYKMPEMGRVMIRMGIQGGPLMNQLVDWKPRVKGMITEYWNGKDKDNLVDLHNHPKFKMIVTYFTLPENSVIAFGNKTQTYRDYKKSIAAERPVKIKRPSAVQKVSHHYGLPRTMDYSPNVNMAFVNAQGADTDGVAVLNDKTLVKVELDEQDKLIFQNQQFEICFFLNGEFYAEDEAGYTPFNWVWDLSNVDVGEHVLTVNISGFKDQIGVLSRKVKVVK